MEIDSLKCRLEETAHGQQQAKADVVRLESKMAELKRKADMQERVVKEQAVRMQERVVKEQVVREL